ncbi:MAG: hypothetical protein M1813_001909 [Trichoglossum hirsutum]|nr:MAG: hypothetical protein M1813_001909 [Trichoglossum hirsutum]
MGNQQSSSSSSTQQKRKLAKPKTNSPASNLPSTNETTGPLASPETPTTATPSVSEVEMAAVGAPVDRRSLPGALQKFRDHSWSSGGNDPVAFKDEDMTVGSIGAIVSGVKDRISRSGSINSIRVSSAKTSLSRLASRGGSPRLSLITEPTTSNAEETALVRQEIEDNVRANEFTALHRHISPSSPTIEYSTEGNSYAPIRRRSLLTPGIATRGRPSNILRKAPPPEELQTQADRDYYFSSFPDTSSPGMRASTPNDLEFGVLGVYGRGTLRITNGAVSPVPSERESEEYFTSSEGRRSPELVDDSNYSVRQERDGTDRAARSLGGLTADEQQRGGSPLRFQRLQDDVEFCEEPTEVSDDPLPSPNPSSAAALNHIEELPGRTVPGATTTSSVAGADTLEDEGAEVTSATLTQSICDGTHLMQQWRSGEHAFSCATCCTNTHQFLTTTTTTTPSGASSPSDNSRRGSLFSRPPSKTDSGYGSQLSVRSVAKEGGPTQQDLCSSDRSASLTSNAIGSSKLWSEQGLEVTHLSPFRRHPGAMRSKEKQSTCPPKEMSVPQPSSPLATATDAAETTTVVVIPPPNSKWSARRSLPAEIIQQAPLSRRPHRKSQPSPALPPLSSTAVQTYRKMSQAHLPPPAVADVPNKPAWRGSKYPPLAFSKPSNERRLSWHSLPAKSGPSTGSGDLCQRGRSISRLSNEKEEVQFAHEGGRTRSRSHGQDPRIDRCRRMTDAPGIASRSKSMRVGQPKPLPTTFSVDEEPKRRSIKSTTDSTRSNAPSIPIRSSSRVATTSKAPIVLGNEAQQTSRSQQTEKRRGFIMIETSYGEGGREPYYGHGGYGAIAKKSPDAWGSNDIPISVIA